MESLHKAKKNETYVVTPVLLTSEPEAIDPNVMPRRYPDENKWVWDLHQEFRAIMEKAVEPLSEFTSQFDKFKDLLKNDADDYIRELEGKEEYKEASAIKNEIVKYTEARD